MANGAMVRENCFLGRAGARREASTVSEEAPWESKQVGLLGECGHATPTPCQEALFPWMLSWQCAGGEGKGGAMLCAGQEDVLHWHLLGRCIYIFQTECAKDGQGFACLGCLNGILEGGLLDEIGGISKVFLLAENQEVHSQHLKY